MKFEGNSSSDMLIQNQQYSAYYAVVKNYAYMKNTTMKKLYEDTKTDWKILACRAGTTDCSVENTWEEKLYQEGNCKAYRPQESASMNIVIAYNESDWTVGWTSFLDGFTMYYQDKQEDPLDFKKSIQG